MLSLLFNKQSRVIDGLEIAGIILSLMILFTDRLSSAVTLWLYIGILICYTVIRFCATNTWYPRTEPPPLFFRKEFPGIETQFKKAMVPTAYILTISMGLILIDYSRLLVLILLLFLIIIAHVNVILLYFHFKDKSPEPVNFLTKLD